MSDDTRKQAEDELAADFDRELEALEGGPPRVPLWLLLLALAGAGTAGGAVSSVVERVILPACPPAWTVTVEEEPGPVAGHDVEVVDRDGEIFLSESCPEPVGVCWCDTGEGAVKWEVCK